jgi:Tol biopolymer transport system component
MLSAFPGLGRAHLRVRFGAKWSGIPAWTPDSSAVIANAILEQGFSIMEKRNDGTPPRELHRSNEPTLAAGGIGSTIAPDGKTWMSASEGSLWRARLDGPGKPERMTPAEWRVNDPRYSPDGKWIVFVAADSGREEILMAPASDPKQRRQLSDGGDSRPTGEVTRESCITSTGGTA